jgi:hypothetical protein
MFLLIVRGIFESWKSVTVVVHALEGCKHCLNGCLLDDRVGSSDDIVACITRRAFQLTQPAT